MILQLKDISIIRLAERLFSIHFIKRKVDYSNIIQLFHMDIDITQLNFLFEKHHTDKKFENLLIVFYVFIFQFN